MRKHVWLAPEVVRTRGSPFFLLARFGSDGTEARNLPSPVYFSRPHLQGSAGMYMNRQVRARLVFRRNCFGVVGPTRASNETETKAHRSLENSLATAVILRLPRFSSIALRKMVRTALTVGIAASPSPVCTVESRSFSRGRTGVCSRSLV